ncbi:hypothetical protein M5K25_027193 [Dendrobium thyrsiflorum]|uniref:Uncharacterized protein n=1 Tax=Dendrobium thyrsiflorum TaxID=117978 RepID=A0ABD0TZK2_DENTH
MKINDYDLEKSQSRLCYPENSSQGSCCPEISNLDLCCSSPPNARRLLSCKTRVALLLSNVLRNHCCRPEFSGIAVPDFLLAVQGFENECVAIQTSREPPLVVYFLSSPQTITGTSYNSFLWERGRKEETKVEERKKQSIAGGYNINGTRTHDFAIIPRIMIYNSFAHHRGISNWYQSNFLGPMAEKRVEALEEKLEGEVGQL